MTYQWKSGARIKTDAAIAGAMLEKLEADGNLTAKGLLDANRPADAPLHNEFEWDDTEAAERWREQQARHIINSIVMSEPNREPVRLFFKITAASPNYHSIDAILSRADTRGALLQQAYRELEAFQKKYAQLTELAAVFEAIQQATA